MNPLGLPHSEQRLYLRVENLGSRFAFSTNAFLATAQFLTIYSGLLTNGIPKPLRRAKPPLSSLEFV
jgi:hypothetical protein